MVTMTIKDSGDRTQFSTGAVRDISSGKGRFDLIPPLPLQRIAVHFENGAKKYGEHNWENGIPLGSFLDSAMRHINKYRSGERDEDHLVAAAWNLLCMIDTEARILSGDLPAELDNGGYTKPRSQACRSGNNSPPP